MKPFTECGIFNYFSLALNQKHSISEEEFFSSYTEYEQCLYDLATGSVPISERLRHLLHNKVELVSLKKLSARTEQHPVSIA